MIGQSIRGGDLEMPHHDECAGNASPRQRPNTDRDPGQEIAAAAGPSTGQPMSSVAAGRGRRDNDMKTTLTGVFICMIVRVLVAIDWRHRQG
jgi:hypothetical protein